MRISLLLLTLSGILCSLSAQITDFPSYEEIEDLISDESLSFYYPSLLPRYIEGDSTMSNMEKICVYYGYIFQDSYDPITPSVHFTALKEGMFYEQNTMPDYEALLEITNAMLEENPFNIQALQYQLYFLDKLEDAENAKIIQTRIDILTYAILQSSEGISMNDPLLVTHMGHDIAIVNYKKLKYLGEQTTMNQIQYLKVKDLTNEFYLYFDIAPILNYMSDM